MKKLFTFIILAIIMSACVDKEESKTKSIQNDSTYTSAKAETEITDSNSITLKYKFPEGKNFSYRLTTNTKSDQKLQSDTTMSSAMDQEVSYVFKLNVVGMDEDNISQIEVTTTSIKMNASINGQQVNYESGLILSSREKAQFAEYESMLNNPFKIRINKKGEVLEVYQIEKIMNEMLSAQGILDSLNADQKKRVYAEAAESAVKPLVQQLFKTLPEKQVGEGSMWQFDYPGTLATFQIVNTAQYTVENIYVEENDSLAKFNAALKAQISGEKSFTENDVDYTFSKPDISADGEIIFNITKGLVENSHTITKVALTTMASSKEENAQKIFKYETTINENKVELL